MPDGTAEGSQGHTAFLAAVIPTTVKTWERTNEGVERKGGLDAILKDGSNVSTVRGVKNAIPNFKLLDPRHHAFARFVLSISEAAIKSQEWPGAKQDDKKVDEDHTDAEKGKDGNSNRKVDSRNQNPDEKADASWVTVLRTNWKVDLALTIKPNLSELLDAGLITPTTLHYVRKSWTCTRSRLEFAPPLGHCLREPRELAKTADHAR
ncbi:hypothetical protein AcV5_003945 [Taiwanofungus camphoratus]|nr:hypothetical protein AcV5_003945 [Antrodia cinnamomea]